MKLLYNRILVRVHKNQERCGMILLPPGAKEDTVRGSVVLAGPGKRNDEGKLIPLSCKPGDVVIFSRHVGQRFTGGEFERRAGEPAEEMLLMMDTDVLAIEED